MCESFDFLLNTRILFEFYICPICTAIVIAFYFHLLGMLVSRTEACAVSLYDREACYTPVASYKEAVYAYAPAAGSAIKRGIV